MGYVQGMCDLLAPLLVILDNGERWGSWTGECSQNRVRVGLTKSGEEMTARSGWVGILANPAPWAHRTPPAK